MALINSETLAEGEDARILVGGKSVRVQCVEIRPRSVLIRVDNEENPRELSLPAP